MPSLVAPQFYSVEQVARILGVERKKVLLLIHTSALPARKIGATWRIATEDLRTAFPPRSTR
jgi:excisionase family DNA binding protein